MSFRRELYVPNGGPDGGDGGKGGDIIFEVDDGLNTLVDFRHVRKYVAQSGEEGGKRRCHGADGKDLIVKVPEGTVVKDLESGKVITDMSGDNRREIILKGGRGGLGNMHFATSTMQVPKYAQPGQPGDAAGQLSDQTAQYQARQKQQEERDHTVLPFHRFPPLSAEMPVEPKPPAPRSVSLRLSESLSCAVATGRSAIWAIRSPGRTTKGLSE